MLDSWGIRLVFEIFRVVYEYLECINTFYVRVVFVIIDSIVHFDMLMCTYTYTWYMHMYINIPISYTHKYNQGQSELHDHPSNDFRL